MMQTLLPPSAQAPALRGRRESATRHIQELMRTVLRGPPKDVFKLSRVALSLHASMRAEERAAYKVQPKQLGAFVLL
jgi:hypothetical protein